MADARYSESRQLDYDSGGGESLVEIAGIVVPANGGPVPLSGDATGLNVHLVDSGGTPIATGQQYVEDAAIPVAGQGTLVVARRDDVLAALTEAEGDAIGLRVDQRGALWTKRAKRDYSGSFTGASQTVEFDTSDADIIVWHWGGSSWAGGTACNVRGLIEGGDAGGSYWVNVYNESNGSWGGIITLDEGYNAEIYCGAFSKIRVTSPSSHTSGSIAWSAAVGRGHAKTNVVTLQGGSPEAPTTLQLQSINPTADAVVLNTASLRATATQMGFNGTSWDRHRTLQAFDAAAATPRVGLAAVALPDQRYTSVSLATAVNSTQSWDTNGIDETIVRVGTTTTGTMIFEVSADGTNWQDATVRDTSTGLWQVGAFTPASGTVYRIVTPGWRSLRARTVTTLGATVALVATAHARSTILNAVDTAPAPHRIGYAIASATAQYATQQTSAVIGPTVSATQRIVVTSIQIQAGGTQAGAVQVYFGTGAYSRGTNPAIFDGEFAPSATLKPGYAQSPPVPYQGALDQEVRVTTSAAINPLTVTIWYYLA